MKAIRQNWLAAKVFGVMTLVIVSGIMAVLAHRLETQQREICVGAMQRMNTALIMYLHDFDERMPLTSNWNHSVMCYYGCGREQNFYDTESCPKLSTRFFGAGYAMVALPYAVSRYEWQTTPSLFETDRIVPNAHATEVILPQPPRHYGGNNIAFLDGHVKTVTPSVRVWEYAPRGVK